MKKPIRMLSITGTGLLPAGHAPEQMTLFEEEDRKKREKQEDLELTLDQIRDRYGKDAISIAAYLNNDLGIKRRSLHDTEEPLK